MWTDVILIIFKSSLVLLGAFFWVPFIMLNNNHYGSVKKEDENSDFHSDFFLFVGKFSRSDSAEFFLFFVSFFTRYATKHFIVSKWIEMDLIQWVIFVSNRNWSVRGARDMPMAFISRTIWVEENSKRRHSKKRQFNFLIGFNGDLGK